MVITVRPFISRSSPSITRRLGFGVERGRGLVEDQDRIVADHGAGDPDALALAAGQRVAALADHGVVPLRHPGDEFVGIGEAWPPR
jgi:hypothetical protein